MSLDDRLRRAHRRQLEDVRRRVEPPVASVTGLRPDRRGPGTRLIVAAAAVGLALVGTAVVVRTVSDGSGSPIRAEAADGGEGDDGSSSPGTAASATSSTSTTATTVNPTTETPTTATSTAAATEAPSSAPATSSPEDSVPGTTGSLPPMPVGGVSNEVCGSGARAELEWAALRYLGDNRGWGRKDDLVDEQDGPFYFEAWEPNHPQPVTVEVLLNDPVLATEIRVAQDPFTEVAGTISFQVIDERFGIELSGVDGWRVHRFDEPLLMDRFTITRTEVESNVMEILVCVVPTP